MRANAGSIPNFVERYRAGEVISSSLAESAVNQVISKRMVKKILDTGGRLGENTQQMLTTLSDLAEWV